MTSSHAKGDQLRPSEPEEGCRILRASGDLQLPATECLVAAGRPASRSSAERFVEFSRANAIPIDAMWAMVDAEGRVLCTVLAIPNPGRTAIMFASAPASTEEVEHQVKVIQYVSEQLQGQGVDLAQVLLEPREGLLRSAYLRGGFTELAHLTYMERPLTGRARTPQPAWPEDVTVEQYQDRHEAATLAALEASYEDTLDCPGLRGLRKTTDILAGHMAAGEFNEQLWTLLRVDGAPAGVLLLNRSPSSNTIELVYIGLAKAARGRGLGRQLLRHGLCLISGRSERAITLAVDDANGPAIAMYRREGFHRVLRRIALIRSLVEPSAAT